MRIRILAQPIATCSVRPIHELETLTAPQLRRLIEAGATTAVVPFGSVEHQGGHLPLGADALLADRVGREVAARLDAVLAPTVRVGCADRRALATGTLSIDLATLRDIAIGICETLGANGFRTIVLISTHGGNREALREAAEELARRRPAIAVRTPAGDVGLAPGQHSGHWLTSVMLELRPDLVQIDAAGPELERELAGASAERGRAHLERFIASIVDALAVRRYAR